MTRIKVGRVRLCHLLNKIRLTWKETLMAYKTVFTAMTQYDENTLEYAAACVASQDAHLDVMCIGLDRIQSNYYEVGANAMIVQTALEEADEKAAALAQRVSERLSRESLRWDVFSSIWAMSGIGHSVANQARFTDLAIIGQPYGPTKRVEEALMLEGLLFQADCPTIIVPPNATFKNASRVVIGWNESAQALRAVRAALPLLKSADLVHIAVIDPSPHGPERSDPGGPLAVFLSRHGISSDIQVLNSGDLRVSERLAQHVREKSANMMVMGGYGHTRFREAILGGATRDMLEHAAVPVLMAH